MMSGTRPESRAWVSAVRIGSSRRPCAAAPCSIVSYALTLQLEQPRPKAARTSFAIGSSATRSRRFVWGVIGMAAPWRGWKWDVLAGEERRPRARGFGPPWRSAKYRRTISFDALASTLCRLSRLHPGGACSLAKTVTRERNVTLSVEGRHGGSEVP